MDASLAITGQMFDAVVEFAGNFESENAMATVTHVYKLEPARAARYARMEGVDGMKPDGSNAVCAVGTDEYDELTEMVVRLNDDGKPVGAWQIEDAIMMETMNLHSFPEFQFAADGPWEMSTAGADSLQQWRDSSFKLYEKSLRQTPPECLASLGRMLHLGPVTQLYGSANDTLFPMAEAEKKDWTVTRGDGKKTYLPRRLNGLRTWDVKARCYTPVDMRLKGAPSPADEEAWFVAVVKHLKSNFQGSPACDQTFLEQNERDLLCKTFKDAVDSAGANKWTDLVFATKGEVQK